MSDWNAFLQERLLDAKILSGLALLSPLGEIIDERGDLQRIDANNWKAIIDGLNDENATSLRLHENHLDLSPDVFFVHNRTVTSVYAATEGEARGLVVCRLSFGVLTCSYRAPHTARSVASLLESFADLLRA